MVSILKKDEGEKGSTEKTSGLEEFEHSLIETKLKISQIEALIEKEKSINVTGNKKLEDLQKQHSELQESKSFFEKIFQARKKELSEGFSINPLKQSDAEKLCYAYFSTDSNWYLAHINLVNEEEQTGEITWIGFRDRTKLANKYIKVIEPPDKKSLTPGIYCECLFKEDACFYPCVIEKVTENGFHVKYQKYNTREIVPHQFLRLSEESKAKKRKLEEIEKSDVFKTPEHLKIKVSDTEQQKKSKKKKIKAMKQNHKQKVIEQERKEKQDNWSDFNAKAKRAKKGYFSMKKGESIFKSPDTVDGKVGVTGSGKGMTNFNPKTKFYNENSQMSRLF
jgi:survival of motor neuron-related-splicing factor 30